MRVLKPKATALIFRNGKIVITGTKSEIEAVLVGRKIVKKLKNFVGNEQVSWDERVQVCNVVGCVGTKLKINLEKMLD
jgi:transcription initiation factor TFIID TATA-box-binding protein